MGEELSGARVFYQEMRCNVVTLSYRGYGLSEGTPSQRGIQMDAQTMLDYVLAHPILQSTQVILYGRSLGGAVAIDLASRNTDSIHALILENTFLSIPLLVRKQMPLLRPMLVFCQSDTWNSEKSISLIPSSVHILLLSGLSDRLVPPEHMKQLSSIVGVPTSASEDGDTAPPAKGDAGLRVWAEFQYGSHNDTCLQYGYWNDLRKFVKRIER